MHGFSYNIGFTIWCANILSGLLQHDEHEIPSEEWWLVFTTKEAQGKKP